MLKILAIILLTYTLTVRADNACREGQDVRRSCGEETLYCISPESGLFCMDNRGSCVIVNPKNATKCSDLNFQELEAGSNPYTSDEGLLMVEPL